MNTHKCQYRVLWAQQEREHFGKHACACFCTTKFCVKDRKNKPDTHEQEWELGCTAKSEFSVHLPGLTQNK